MHDSGAYKLSGITARDGMSWDELLAKAEVSDMKECGEGILLVLSNGILGLYR